LETLATPVTRDNYNWDVFENGILFAGAGIVGVIVFLSIKPLSKYMNDRVLLILGCLIMASGFIVSSEFNGKMSLPQFIVGSFLISVGYPIGQVMVYAVYAKVLGSATQGALMGWLTGFGAVARTLGPIWSSFGYEKAAEVGEEIVFLICAGLAISAAIAVTLAYSKLVTPSYGQLQDEDDAESSSTTSSIKAVIEPAADDDANKNKRKKSNLFKNKDDDEDRKIVFENENLTPTDKKESSIDGLFNALKDTDEEFADFNSVETKK